MAGMSTGEFLLSALWAFGFSGVMWLAVDARRSRARRHNQIEDLRLRERTVWDEMLARYLADTAWDTHWRMEQEIAKLVNALPSWDAEFPAVPKPPVLTTKMQRGEEPVDFLPAFHARSRPCAWSSYDSLAGIFRSDAPSHAKNAELVRWLGMKLPGTEITVRSDVGNADGAHLCVRGVDGRLLGYNTSWRALGDPLVLRAQVGEIVGALGEPGWAAITASAESDEEY